MTADPSDDDDPSRFDDNPIRRFTSDGTSYVLVRFVFLRGVGLLYFVAFLSLANQIGGLLGSHGILPAARFLDNIARFLGSRSEGFWRLPSIFWIGCSDATLYVTVWIGTILSLAIMLGATNAILQFVVWALYLSFVHIGQIFYGYGWESQLCETGFLAIFLCPLLTVKPFPKEPPDRIVIWLLRWLIARIMLGAGLIKLRGDPCWRDLTCLVYHYETQPNPNPLSWLLHQAPEWFHKGGVVWNHVVEVVAPFFAFGPRKARLVAGCLFVSFQIILILSGNLSFLNWLTILPAIACFDDAFLERLFPKRLRERARDLAKIPVPRMRRRVSIGLAIVVALLSLGPIENLTSSHQSMNRSFDPFQLVNTYGAFGSVGKVREAVILEGTSDSTITDATVWREYELPCAPGDVTRRPCIVSPYHYRLDWQIWFAPFYRPEQQPWLIRVMLKLLQGDKSALGLFSKNPFPDAPPKYVRASLYRYHFTRIGDGSRAWWTRERVRQFIHPLALDDPDLHELLAENGLDE